MSDHGKPDKPGLWRDANEKTVVACMESGELRMRDPDTGMVLSGEWVERPRRSVKPNGRGRN